MAVWPATLPSPQKVVSLTIGDNRLTRKLQSGRTESRSFGVGKPDFASLSIRFLWSEWEEFREFFTNDLNQGINWFSASWLTDLGYISHKAKIQGYPRESGRQLRYIDVSVIIFIQDASATPDDIFWPCLANGTIPDPPPISVIYGYVFYGAFTLNCYQYIALTNIWTSKSDCILPARYYSTAFGMDAAAYICGGTTPHRITDCDKFELDTWLSRSDLLEALYFMASIAIGSYGYTFNGATNLASTYCMCYDPTTNTWVYKTDVIEAKYGSTAETINNKAYNAVGGNPQGTSCLEYNPNTDSWDGKTDAPLPTRYRSCSFEIDSKMFIVGGYPTYWFCDEYYPVADSWTKKTEIPIMASAQIGAVLSNNGYALDIGYCYQYYGDFWLDKANPPSSTSNGSGTHLRGV